MAQNEGRTTELLSSCTLCVYNQLIKYLTSFFRVGKYNIASNVDK